MFSVIASSGHCGTRWLSAVLDEGTDTAWHHHLREQMTGLPWQKLDRLSVTDPVFSPYWERIATGGDIGDANSWPPHLLPRVDARFKIDRVIYLTRNGVQQLHSLTTTSAILRRDPLPDTAENKLARLYHASRQEKRFDEMTRWERLCLMVAANDFMPAWLANQGLPVEVYSLDVLLSDVNTLKKLAPKLTKTALKKWQETDINRKVQGGRSPAFLWRKWTEEQRDAYREIVGSPEL